MLEAVTQPFLNEFPQIHPLGTGIVSEPYVLCSFTQIVGSTLLDDFRKLRIGFVEAGIKPTGDILLLLEGIPAI
jgi:hypothetical protein